MRSRARLLLLPDRGRKARLRTGYSHRSAAAGRLEGHEPEGRQAGSRRPAAGPARRGAAHHRRPAWRHTQWRVCGVVEHRDVKKGLRHGRCGLTFLNFSRSVFCLFPFDFSQLFTFFNHVFLSFPQGQAQVRPASRQARRDDEFRLCLKFEVGERSWAASGRGLRMRCEERRGAARKRGCGAVFRVAGGGRRGGVRPCVYF